MDKELINKIGTALIEKYGMQDGVDLFVDLVAELQESAIMIRMLEAEKEKDKEKEEKAEKGDKIIPDQPLTTPSLPYPYVPTPYSPIWGGGSGTGEQPTWDWGKVTCDGSEAPKAYYGNYKNETGGASIASTSAETATSSQTKMVKIMDSAGVVFEVPESSFGIYAESLKARDERARNERRAEAEKKAESDGRGPKKSPKKD